MIILPILTTSLINVSVKELGGYTFWTWEQKMSRLWLTVFIPSSDPRRIQCDHRRATVYFIESVSSRHSFPSYPCKNLQDFDHGRCLRCGGAGQCPSMGYYANTTKEHAAGKHFLFTNKSPPFSGRVHVISLWCLERHRGNTYLTSLPLVSGNTYSTSFPLVSVRHHGRVIQWMSR